MTLRSNEKVFDKIKQMNHEEHKAHEDLNKF